MFGTEFDSLLFIGRREEMRRTSSTQKKGEGEILIGNSGHWVIPGDHVIASLHVPPSSYGACPMNDWPLLIPLKRIISKSLPGFRIGRRERLQTNGGCL